jgi:hypothetical protein
LTLKHLEAVGLAVERLRSQNVGEEDVAQCDAKWELSGVNTVPSLGQVLSQWDVFYQVEESDDESSQDTAGNNDSNTSTGQ